MNRVLAWLRSASRPRQYPAAANGWERTWQAHRELYDDLDPPPPSYDPYIVKNPQQGGSL